MKDTWTRSMWRWLVGTAAFIIIASFFMLGRWPICVRIDGKMHAVSLGAAASADTCGPQGSTLFPLR